MTTEDFKKFVDGLLNPVNNKAGKVDARIKALLPSPSDEIILYIPNIVEGYPDMVGDGWTLADVEAFCQKYGVELKIKYEETLQYTEGTLISQSRSPKTPILSGSSLTIVVAKEPEANEDPKQDESDLDDTIHKVLTYDGPVLCEVMVQEFEEIKPKIASRVMPDGSLRAAEFDDLYPFLN